MLRAQFDTRSNAALLIMCQRAMHRAAHSSTWSSMMSRQISQSGQYPANSCTVGFGHCHLCVQTSHVGAAPMLDDTTVHTAAESSILYILGPSIGRHQRDAASWRNA